MYPHPKSCADFQWRWSSDGSTLHLFNRKTRQTFRLPRGPGQLLCRLDGWTYPACSSGLSTNTVFRYLCLLARHGLLQEPESLLTAPGTLLLGIPCRKLRQGRHSVLLQIYGRLIDWLWLPLTTAVLAVCSQPALPPVQIHSTPFAITVSVILMNILNLILHELAHAAAANVRGVPVSSVGVGIDSFLPCAFIMAPLIPYAPSHIRRAIYRAGPLSNLCLGCILLLLYLKIPLFRVDLLFLAAIGNFVLALINLLPLDGFDGNAILCTFPSLDRVLNKSRLRRRNAWENFFETVSGHVLRGMLKAGMFLFFVYEALCLINLFLGVLTS